MRACEQCGVEFEPSKPSQKFCSPLCRQRAYRERQREARVSGLLEPATSERALELSIARAAATQWRAAAWLLERRWPERWSATRRAESSLERADDDPFREVDELAAKRRALLTHDT